MDSNDVFPGMNVNIYVNGFYMLGIIIGCLVLFGLAQYSSWIYVAILLIFMVGVWFLFNINWKRISKKSKNTKKHTNKSKEKSEVFHVSNNLFSYEDAQQVCKAYNGRLATYDDMVSAHKSGADWCTYGWSDDQNVFYPTQKSKYDKLKAIPGHEHDCGHPGVNGGYIEDKSILFGVNCYGKKPDPNADELALMSIAPSLPITQQDIEMENNLAYWKQNKSKLLLAPFNQSKWHSYNRI